jgi:hypothetical protein
MWRSGRVRMSFGVTLGLEDQAAGVGAGMRDDELDEEPRAALEMESYPLIAWCQPSFS